MEEFKGPISLSYASSADERRHITGTSGTSATTTSTSKKKQKLNLAVTLASSLTEAKRELQEVKLETTQKNDCMMRTLELWVSAKSGDIGEDAEKVLGEKWKQEAKELGELKEELHRAQEKVDKCTLALEEHANKTAPLPTLPPSRINSSNFQQAGGNLRLNDRDSGVARHPLFLAVTQSMAVQHTTNNSSLSWKTKADLVYQAVNESHKLSNFDGESFWKSVKKISATENRQHWSDLIDAISKARSHESQDNQELWFSDMLASSLMRLCIDCSIPHMFMHQVPCCHSQSYQMDIAACRTLQGSCPRSMLGIIEVKRSKKHDGKWQICSYLSRLNESHGISGNRNVSFGLTIDHETICLYGYLWTKREQASDPTILLETSLLLGRFTLNSPGLEWESCLQTYIVALFALACLKDGVSDPDFCAGVKAEEPVQKMTFKLFRGERSNTALKVFDYPYVVDPAYSTSSVLRQPNIQWIKVAHPDLKKIDVTTSIVHGCGTVTVLKTPWYQGQHTPKFPKHIELLCAQLHRLHVQNMTHGDVLCQNVLFGGTQTKPTTRLIDFDYSHLERYPSRFNTNFMERHPKVCGGAEVHSSHDVYAVIVMLCKYFKKIKGTTTVAEAENQLTLWQEFFESNPFDETKQSHDHRSSCNPDLTLKWQQATAKEVGRWIAKRQSQLELSEKELFFERRHL